MDREPMFEKVVTPSDVGKLNRLVIPKQHAEKYFPLDPTATEKGLLLTFEDTSGKSWRFRYSYWNSSQSYVMTKGWSRFVKDKKLDAGDVVSFLRANINNNNNNDPKFFIDWRKRAPHFGLPLLPFGLYRSYPHPHVWDHLNAPHVLPCQHPHWRGIGPVFLRQPQVPEHPPAQGLGLGGEPRVLDSVPVVQGQGKVAGKRLRLFGVNMDCEDASTSSLSLDLDM